MELSKQSFIVLFAVAEGMWEMGIIKSGIIVIKTPLGGVDAFLQQVLIQLSNSPESSFDFNIADSQIDIKTFQKNDLKNLDLLLKGFVKDDSISTNELNNVIKLRNQISRRLYQKG